MESIVWCIVFVFSFPKRGTLKLCDAAGRCQEPLGDSIGVIGDATVANKIRFVICDFSEAIARVWKKRETLQCPIAGHARVWRPGKGQCSTVR